MSNADSQSERTLSIVTVPFYGDLVEAYYNTKDDSVYVSVRRVCENLGIDSDGQSVKLRNYHWATPEMISGVAQDGSQRPLMFLPLVQLPMWLAGISPSKIGAGPDMIAKLKRYQLEAVDVLAKHFVVSKPEPESQDPVLALLEAARIQRQAQLELESKVERIEERVNDLVELRTAALQLLTEVPRSDQPAAPLTTRAKISMLVRTFVEAHGLEFAEERGLELASKDRGDVYAAVWRELYKQFNYRYHFDVYARCRHSGRSKLDEIEWAGRLEDFYAMVSAILV